MKNLWYAVLALAAGSGCLGLPPSWHAARKEPEPIVTKPAPPKPPVTSDQVNDSNAREKAKALQEELDRAAREEPPAPVESLEDAQRTKHKK